MKISKIIFLFLKFLGQFFQILYPFLYLLFFSWFWFPFLFLQPDKIHSFFYSVSRNSNWMEHHHKIMSSAKNSIKNGIGLCYCEVNKMMDWAFLTQSVLGSGPKSAIFLSLNYGIFLRDFTILKSLRFWLRWFFFFLLYFYL